MLLKLMGGLFLTFTMISPVVNLDFSNIWDFLEECTLKGENAAAWGEAMAEEEYRTIIRERTEAYILDKADALGVTLSVEVTLSDDDVLVPEEAALRGKVSPYAKQQLQQMCLMFTLQVLTCLPSVQMHCRFLGNGLLKLAIPMKKLLLTM